MKYTCESPPTVEKCLEIIETGDHMDIMRLSLLLVWWSGHYFLSDRERICKALERRIALDCSDHA